MNLFKRYLNYFDSHIAYKKHELLRKDISFWKDFLFMRLLSVIFPLSMIVVIPSLIMCIREEMYIVGFIDFATVLIVAIISIKKSIGLIVKKYLLVGSVYILSGILIILIGKDGPGFYYLLAISLVIILTIGQKAAYFSVGLNAISIIVLSLISNLGNNSYSISVNSSLASDLVMGLNFMFINIFSVLAVSFLIEGLGKTLIEDRSSKLKAEESDQLKSAFLANVSHEIRTPLNAILGFSDLARDEDYSEAEKIRFLDNINSSGEHLLSIINSIVDISIIEAGQIDLNYSQFNLQDLMTDCYYQIQGIKKTAQIEIELKTSEDIIINSDKGKLNQVVMNLLTNALKFTVEGEITMGYQANHKLVTVMVKDTGIGISPENGENLFDRFYKIHNSNEFKSGAGLGLAISKGIVNALGGDIWYESEEKVGSTFHFSIPIDKQQ